MKTLSFLLVILFLMACGGSVESAPPSSDGGRTSSLGGSGGQAGNAGQGGAIECVASGDWCYPGESICCEASEQCYPSAAIPGSCRVQP